ncbi:MAG TPA: hypothetical protein DCE44_02865 [Verrucomicrobiales bacterium]|nr:hypothetical protein [Verrucomicrobiales bacterium]
MAHLGWGDWVIIDSCIDPETRVPIGIGYIKGLGLDPAMVVRQVFATHWHNDHVRGLAQTMKECAGAKFICPGVFFDREFIALTELWKQQEGNSSPLVELTGAMESVTQRASSIKGGCRDSAIRFAVANKRLWYRPHSNGHGRDSSAEIYSLSPSDAAVAKSLEAIKALFPQAGTLTQPVANRPNQISVVLWMRIADVSCLLGADMEERGNTLGGWRLIVESAERPCGQASVFKVPHHGSVTGEFGEVWDQMLVREPIALLTPFRSGRVTLPAPGDVDRVCGRTPHAFITSRIRDRSSRSKSGSVNRSIHEAVRYIRKVNDSFGQVRARRRLRSESAEWLVETFGDARPLRQFYNQ